MRYLEQLELKLVRESLVERGQLLKTAPHLVAPLRFLVPIYRSQKRPGLKVHAGLALYDLLSIGDGLPPSGRLGPSEIADAPAAPPEGLDSILHYDDCQADDARLTLAVLLDARARGADIKNRRAVIAIEPLANGYGVELDEARHQPPRGGALVVNASGPWVASVDALATSHPPSRPLRLVRGSHIVLPKPAPAQADAYTLQDSRGPRDLRPAVARPALSHRRHHRCPPAGDPGTAVCSAAERTYLLDAYNRTFASPGGPATTADVVFTWSGVRALADDAAAAPDRVSRQPGPRASSPTARAACHPLWRQAHNPPRLRRGRARRTWRPWRPHRTVLDQGRAASWRQHSAARHSLARAERGPA